MSFARAGLLHPTPPRYTTPRRTVATTSSGHSALDEAYAVAAPPQPVPAYQNGRRSTPTPMSRATARSELLPHARAGSRTPSRQVVPSAGAASASPGTSARAVHFTAPGDHIDFSGMDGLACAGAPQWFVYEHTSLAQEAMGAASRPMGDDNGSGPPEVASAGSGRVADLRNQPQSAPRRDFHAELQALFRSEMNARRDLEQTVLERAATLTTLYSAAAYLLDVTLTTHRPGVGAGGAAAAPVPRAEVRVALGVCTPSGVQRRAELDNLTRRAATQQDVLERECQRLESEAAEARASLEAERAAHEATTRAFEAEQRAHQAAVARHRATTAAERDACELLAARAAQVTERLETSLKVRVARPLRAAAEMLGHDLVMLQDDADSDAAARVLDSGDGNIAGVSSGGAGLWRDGEVTKAIMAIEARLQAFALAIDDVGDSVAVLEFQSDAARDTAQAAAVDLGRYREERAQMRRAVRDVRAAAEADVEVARAEASIAQGARSAAQSEAASLRDELHVANTTIETLRADLHKCEARAAGLEDDAALATALQTRAEAEALSQQRRQEAARDLATRLQNDRTKSIEAQAALQTQLQEVSCALEIERDLHARADGEMRRARIDSEQLRAELRQLRLSATAASRRMASVEVRGGGDNQSQARSVRTRTPVRSFNATTTERRQQPPRDTSVTVRDINGAAHPAGETPDRSAEYHTAVAAAAIALRADNRIADVATAALAGGVYMPDVAAAAAMTEETIATLDRLLTDYNRTAIALHHETEARRDGERALRAAEAEVRALRLPHQVADVERHAAVDSACHYFAAAAAGFARVAAEAGEGHKRALYDAEAARSALEGVRRAATANESRCRALQVHLDEAVRAAARRNHTAHAAAVVRAGPDLLDNDFASPARAAITHVAAQGGDTTAGAASHPSERQSDPALAPCASSPSIVVAPRFMTPTGRGAAALLSEGTTPPSLLHRQARTSPGRGSWQAWGSTAPATLDVASPRLFVAAPAVPAVDCRSTIDPSLRGKLRAVHGAAATPPPPFGRSSRAAADEIERRIAAALAAADALDATMLGTDDLTALSGVASEDPTIDCLYRDAPVFE